MVRKVVIILIALGWFAINSTVYSQTIETSGDSVEDSLLGGSGKLKPQSAPATKSKAVKKKSAAQKKSSSTKPGPRIDAVAIDDVNLRLVSCATATGSLNCKGFISCPNGTNFSLQCYSGSYLVAEGREVGCLSARISDVQSWSYVAVGLTPNEDIPFEITFSNAGSSVASAINMVVSTPGRRNATLAFKNIGIR